MKNAWNEVCPEFAFNFQFYDDWLNSLYAGERHTAYIIRIFAIFSVLLTCLGTFGIIHFITRQKTKEIGIRKVHGARINDILNILTWSILKWILLAYIIAVPLAYFLMLRYLHGFAYKVRLSWWIFVISGLIAFTIALLTVS